MAKKSSKNDVMAAPSMDTQWRARDDAETLRRAGEIMGDRGRVKAAQVELQKGMAAIQKIAGVTTARAPRSNTLGLAKGRR